MHRRITTTTIRRREAPTPPIDGHTGPYYVSDPRGHRRGISILIMTAQETAVFTERERDWRVTPGWAPVATKEA